MGAYHLFTISCSIKRKSWESSQQGQTNPQESRVGPQGSIPRSTRLEEYSNRRARFLASTEANGTEIEDSPPNFSKIAETQASKTRQGSCNKEERETSTLLQQRGQTTKRAQTWRYSKNEARSRRSKEAVEESNMSTRSRAKKTYEAHIEGTRVRKDLIVTQESPEIDNHVGESDEPHMTDDQSQRFIDPVQPGVPLPEDTAQERPETSQTAPEIPQPTPRRSARGRLIRTPIRLKDYSKPWEVQSSRTINYIIDSKER